jgi:hypothetical protein
VLLVFEPKLKQTGGNRPITFPLAAVVLVSLSLPPSLSLSLDGLFFFSGNKLFI